MADGPAALTPDERAELDRLRAENASLRSGRTGGWGRAGRWTGATVLLLVSALLFAVAVVAVFVRTQVLDTDRYVETVAPLARDPAIQDAIANRITAAILAQVDLKALADELVQGLTERGAPEAINALVGPAVSGLESFIGTQVHKVVASDKFAQAWDAANRAVHNEVEALLTTGQGRLLSVKGTEVSINLGAVLDMVKQQLVASGFGLAAKIPQTSVTVPLFKSEDLPRIQTYVSWLNTAAWLLPLLALALLLAGVVVAPNRRRGLLIGSVMFALAMLIMLGVLAGVRTYYLNNLPDSVQSPDAVAAIYDTETRFLISSLQTFAVLFGIVALICWLAGPSAPARFVKRIVDSGLDAAARMISHTGVSLGAVPGWLHQARRTIIVGVVLVAIAILVIWRQPGIAGVVWVTVGALVLLGLVEIVARTNVVEPPHERRTAVA